MARQARTEQEDAFETDFSRGIRKSEKIKSLIFAGIAFSNIAWFALNHIWEEDARTSFPGLFWLGIPFTDWMILFFVGFLILELLQARNLARMIAVDRSVSTFGRYVVALIEIPMPTVIYGAVNIASRLEGLTKEYWAPIIASKEALSKCLDKSRVRVRDLGIAELRGGTGKIAIAEEAGNQS